MKQSSLFSVPERGYEISVLSCATFFITQDKIAACVENCCLPSSNIKNDKQYCVIKNIVKYHSEEKAKQ